MSKIIERATRDFYWGILPREEMQRFVAAAKTEGFGMARKTFPFSGPFDYADDFSRADFHFFLPAKQDARILDLGSGFGNVTIPLSYHYENVTAADASRELLDISRIRADELGRENVEFVHVDPLGSSPLPFTDGSYDVVILNGVLEWVGLSGETEDPRAIQGFLLSEVKRVLSPRGVVYIGIENRWFPGWWGRDPHSKLPFTVFLPRPLADWYARLKGHTGGYRTYIYGYNAFLNLFKERGFQVDRLLIPFSSYRYPTAIYERTKETSSYLFGKGGGKSIYTAKWLTLLKMLYLVGMEHLMVASFMFVLAPHGTRATATTLLSRLLGAKHADVFQESDVLLKVPSKDNGTFIVEALRAGADQPYGRYTITRLPNTAGVMPTSYQAVGK